MSEGREGGMTVYVCMYVCIYLFIRHGHMDIQKKYSDNENNYIFG